MDALDCVQCGKSITDNPLTNLFSTENQYTILKYHLNCNCYKYYKQELFCPDCFYLVYVLDKILK